MFFAKGTVAMKSRTDKSTIVKTAVLLLVSFVVFIVLFWRLVVEYPGPGGNYFSDICEHLLYGKTYGIKGEYSLTLLIDDLLLGLGSAGSWLVAAHLALIVILEIVFGCMLIKKIVPEGNVFTMSVLSLCCLMVIPIFVPFINRHMYGTFAGNCWHNENYHGMRAFSVLLLVFLFDLIDDYLKKFNIKQMIVFALLLAIINAIKPNFILGFAPALLVMMIADIIRSKGKGFFRWVMFGMSVLISLPVLLWQYFVSFDASVETSEGASLIFVVGDYFKLFAHPILDFFTGMAFPLAMLILFRREFFGNRFYKLCMGGFIVAFLEMFFIAESGERFVDGNMGWGLQFFIYLMFLLGIAEYYRYVLAYMSDRKRGQSLSSYLQTKSEGSVKVLIPGLLFAVHLALGVMYFAIVYTGVTGYLV